MFQGIFKSAINDANKNYIFGTGSIPIQIKTAQLATFADGTTKQQGYQVAEVSKLISTMLTGWGADGSKPKSMSDNYLELILSCDNGFVVKKRLQFPHIIAWQNDDTPYNIADVYKPFSIDNWLKADDFENPDITLVVEPTDEILTTSTATPPEATTTNSGRFYLYYRNLPVGVNRIHIDFHIKTKTEPIDFDLEVIDGLSWKDAQTIFVSDEQAKINVLLGSVKDVYKFTGAEGNFEEITMHEWSALYQQIISLKPNNKFTHDLYFYIYDESEINTKITELEGKMIKICYDNSYANLNIGDTDGNVILSLSNGNVKTKNFNSEKIIKYEPYFEGLKVFDLFDVECSPLGSSIIPSIEDAGISADASILRDGYGCLYLPPNYSPYGEPVRLILFATGGHTFLDKEHGWMPSAQPWTDTVIKDLTERGYAVFGASVPGVTYQQWLDNAQYGVPMGLPDIMECSYRAYQYIIAHYNVCKEIYIWGCSEGGLLALNWAYTHSDIVAAIAHCAGCVSIYSEWICYGSWNTLRERVASILGFNVTTGEVDSYETEKANVFDPYTRLITIDSKQYISWHTPIKFFWGTADDVLTTDSVVGHKYQYIINYHNAIRNSGGISFLKWYDGFNHEDVAMGRQQSVRNDVINWFNHF